MSILLTSKFIQNMYENERDEDEDENFINETDKEEYYKRNVKQLFDMFASNKKLNIDYGTINNFLFNFDKLYNGDFFTSFQPPIVQEYFCKQLNFLLLVDFILSFFKTSNSNFNIKEINTRFIFDFFVKLGDFYNFMNFLDVDETFIKYLKFMIVLYTVQLDRDVIESSFSNIIEIIDNFFTNDVIPKVFKDINYGKLDNINKEIENIQKCFDIKNMSPDIDYTKDTEYLDELFTYNNLSVSNPISVKRVMVEEPNPLPQPFDYNENNIDDDDDYYDDDDSYDRRWTPTIKVQRPKIEESDSNYKAYREKFAFKQYQLHCQTRDSIEEEIQNIRKDIRINDYSKLNFKADNINEDIIKIKTILGIVPEFEYIMNNRSYKQQVFNVACEYGHLHIIKEYVKFTEGELDVSDAFSSVASSPNREIYKYIKDNIKTYKSLNNYFYIIDNITVHEPKIKLTNL